MESSEQDKSWPMPSFYFRVAINSEILNVSEVSGLAIRIQDGVARLDNVILKRGLFAGDNILANKFDEAVTDGATAWTVTVDLLDEAGKCVRRWALLGARPVKFTGPDLRSDSNEAAYEQLEIASDKMIVSIP